MPQHDHAKASGANSTIREIGVALGIAVLTAVFAGNGGELTRTGYVDAAQPAVIVGATVVTASAIIAAFVPTGRGQISTDRGSRGESVAAAEHSSAATT